MNTCHHYIKRKQYKGPSTVKIQIALERATHKDPPTGTSEPNYRILLIEVIVIIVILEWHLQKVASRARVEVVVHCSSRSGNKKTSMVDRGENASLQNN